jgi:DNA-binding NarL/FixJ family response regulator
MAISVSIIEDNPAFMQRFTSTIRSEPRFVLAGTAVNGALGMALIDRIKSDVYLIDLGLPDMDGTALIRHALQTHPGANVMVITVFGDDAHVISSIEAGATGYILKDSSEPEIVEGIHEIANGGSPLSPVVANKLLKLFRASQSVKRSREKSPEAGASASLTDREIQILRLLSTGAGFREIAETLGISVHTVAQHNRNIYSKLVVRSRGEAVFEATKIGLINF